MKALGIIILFIILCSSVHAQPNAVDSLKAYVKKEGYVPITRKAKLPKAILPYYHLIMDSIKHADPKMQQWYIRLNSFKSDNDFISFYLYPLSAIAFMKKAHDNLKVFNSNKINKIRLQDLWKDTVPTKILPPDIVDKIQIVDDYGGTDGWQVSKIQIINDYGVNICYLKSSRQVKMSPISPISLN